MGKVDKKRLTAWAIALIIIGLLSAFFMPADTLAIFVGLLKSIIQHLLVGI
jgi:hypothetical protein